MTRSTPPHGPTHHGHRQFPLARIRPGAEFRSPLLPPHGSLDRLAGPAGGRIAQGHGGDVSRRHLPALRRHARTGREEPAGSEAGVFQQLDRAGAVLRLLPRDDLRPLEAHRLVSLSRRCHGRTGAPRQPDRGKAHPISRSRDRFQASGRLRRVARRRSVDAAGDPERPLCRWPAGPAPDRLRDRVAARPGVSRDADRGDALGGGRWPKPQPTDEDRALAGHGGRGDVGGDQHLRGRRLANERAGPADHVATDSVERGIAHSARGHGDGVWQPRRQRADPPRGWAAHAGAVCLRRPPDRGTHGARRGTVEQHGPSHR